MEMSEFPMCIKPPISLLSVEFDFLSLYNVSTGTTMPSNLKGDKKLILLPYMDGFYRSGEKVSETTVFTCCNCNSKRTVKSGKTIPKCSKCNDYTYWFKIVTL